MDHGPCVSANFASVKLHCSLLAVSSGFHFYVRITLYKFIIINYNVRAQPSVCSLNLLLVMFSLRLALCFG